MAFMYDDNGTKIGTKSRQAGQGLVKPDGSYGDGVTMNFNPPKPKNSIVNSLAQSQKSQFPNNYPNGIKPPQVHLQTGEENTNKIGNFLQYLTDKRNANMMQKYDALNMKNNQFIQTLKNSKFQAGQNRLEREQLQNQRLAQQQGQFNKTFDFNSQKFDRTHDLDMQKYLHPIRKTDNTEKYKIDRTKLFTKNPTSIVPEWEDLEDGQKKQVMQHYISTGTVPKINKVNDGWFSDTYSLDTQPQQSSNRSTQQTLSDEEKQFNEWKKRQGNY